MEILIPAPRVKDILPTSYFLGNRFVKELTADSFTPDGKLKDKKCHFIMFYRPDCMYCKKLKKIWLNLAEIATFYSIAAFNTALLENTKSYTLPRNVDKLIDGFPTCIIYCKGLPKEVYTGQNKINDLLEFLLTKC